MPPKANLQYTAPKVPAFLQKLHAQVNNGRSGGRSGSGSGAESYGEALRPDEGDDLAALVGSTSSGGPDTVHTGAADSEDEEDWQGAQVVVLKEGKHLSEDEINRLRSKEKDEANEEKERAEKATKDSLSRKQISTSIGSAPSKRKRRGDITSTNDEDVSSSDDEQSTPKPNKIKSKDTLAGAKELIEAERQRKLKETRRRDKEREKVKKNRNAKKEIGKRGKGLSFDFED